MISPSIPSNILTMAGAFFCDPQPVPAWLPSTPAIILATVYKYKYIRRLVRIQKICHRKVNDLDTKYPVIVEPLEVPSSPEQALAPKERTVPDVVHPVQCGIVSERITVPRPDDEILSGYDEDVSSNTRRQWYLANS